MLIALTLTLAAAFAQGPPLPTVTQVAEKRAPPRAHAREPADSLRVLRAARRAQENFESVRRRYLPREFGITGHHCDVVVGRWCVWNDDSNDRDPPPEAPRIREARERLVGVLDSLGELRPSDEWIVGQAVRYLLEAGRYNHALRAAARCRDSAERSYLCRALGALALHDSGAVAAADSAYADALGAMPTEVRCRWTDISLLLEPDLEHRYAKLDCAARDSMAEAYWRLGAPLYLLERDWHNEFLSRVTRAELAREARGPMGSPKDESYRETALRYGFDTWYVMEEPPVGSMREPTIAGYRSQGSGYNFIPAQRVFASPAELRLDDWDVKLRTAQTMYAPAYLRQLRQVERRQIALFRRADTTLVVAAYDVSGDTLLSRQPLVAGLFSADVAGAKIDPPIGAVDSSATSTGWLVLRAPPPPPPAVASSRPHPMILSLELFDRSSKSAARLRYGVRPRADGGRIDVSDLLLFAPTTSDAAPHHLAEAIERALTTTRVSARRPLGLYWETYGVKPEGEVIGVGLTIERAEGGWLRRAAEKVKLATRSSPLRLEWQEVPDRAEYVASRAVTIDLSRMAPGRYEIRLVLTPRDQPPVETTREIIVDR